MPLPSRRLILTTVILTLMDTAYLAVMRRQMVRQIEAVQRATLHINPVGFVFSYIFLVAALYYFVIRRRLGWMDGALLGAAIYGVYDATNLATFKDWSLAFAAQDVAWGSFLFGATTFLVGRYKFNI